MPSQLTFDEIHALRLPTAAAANEWAHRDNIEAARSLQQCVGENVHRIDTNQKVNLVSVCITTGYARVCVRPRRIEEVPAGLLRLAT